MVQFRGITVSMISQHGIRRLPEYEPPISADPFRIDGPTPRSENDSIASCYVPAYPGSQIWFDYSIENPHPPNAQYFFKLLRNGEVFTSWDCTAKHDYQGRTTYALKYLGIHPQTGQPVIERQAFRFSTEPPSQVGPFDDCIEVRVHRIEHRERLPLEAANVRAHEVLAGENIYSDGVRLVSGGLIGPNDPKRQYKYQLLDPVDKPYATIKFYYRPLESLTAMGIVTPTRNHSRHTSTASDRSRTSSESNSASRTASIASSNRSPTRSESSTGTGSSRRGTPPTDSVTAWLHHHRLQKYTPILAALSFDTLVTFSDHDLARLGVAAKGSRAKLLRELEACKQQHLKQVEVVPREEEKEKDNGSVSRRKSLKIEINGAVFDLEKKDSKGPLSPFTSGGMLRRRLLSQAPSSAPANITAFGPTIEDEVNEIVAGIESGGKGKSCMRRTTRKERGGGILSRMLGKRISRG